jgi:hypothetical protein
MAKPLNEATGSRNRITYDGDIIYVFISCEAKEIFISSVSDQIPKVAAIYDSLTRMISLAWQNNDIEDIVTQLNKSSRSKSDLPGLFADLFIQKQEL